MLTEVQIEIVDDAGHVEDRVRIVGSGEVAVATTDTSRLQLTSDDPTDVDAVIALRDGAVTIEARKPEALRVDDAFLPTAKPRDVQRALIAFITASNRRLHVRVTENPTAWLLSSEGLVIREHLRRSSAAAHLTT